MQGLWRVRLYSPTGGFVAVMDSYEQFQLERRVNGLGTFAIRLAADDEKVSLIKLDSELMFYHSVPDYGIDWYEAFVGLHRSGVFETFGPNEDYFTASGYCPNHLLYRRFVDAPAGSSEAQKSGKAETVMKEIVTEQCCTPPRDTDGLSVEPDEGRGSNWSGGFSKVGVLDMCVRVGAGGGGDFDVVRTAPVTYLFRWHTEQLGTDRTDSVIFSAEQGNIASLRFTDDRSAEVNAILAAGQGLGEERKEARAWDSARIADSPRNRMEMYSDARHEDTEEGLIKRAKTLLVQNRPRCVLEVDVAQTQECALDKHYFLGDLVTVVYRGVTYVRKVTRVVYAVGPEGEAPPFVELEDPFFEEPEESYAG